MERKIRLLLICIFTNIGIITAQTSTVSGIVVSAEDDAPVIGASILVVGSSLGTVTGIDGKFLSVISQIPPRRYASLLWGCSRKRYPFNRAS